MSETVSFLGGAAIAGLAAVVLVRGLGPSYSNPPAPQATPAPVVSPSPLPTPVPSPVAASPTCTATSQDEARKGEMDTFKLQTEQQKLEIEKLKFQIQKQEGLIQTVTTQTKNGIGQAGVDPTQNNLPAATGQSSSIQASNHEVMNPVMTGMLWVAGGLLSCLVVGGFLLGIFAVFARQQPRHRIPPTYYYPLESERPAQRVRYAEPIKEQPMPKRARQRNYD